MATIKDVARETGLAVGTISRYLNGMNIKDANKMAIELAIQKLDYKRNSVARSMKTGKTMTIAFIVPHLTNVFAMRLIESIEKVLVAYDYSVIVAACSGSEKHQVEKINLLKSKMVDGFIIMPVSTNAEKIKNMVGDTPVVLIDRFLDKNIFDSVTINNVDVCYESVKKVLQKGITKIGLIASCEDISTANERRKGYEMALDEFNINKNYIIEAESNYQSGYDATKAFINNDLEAIFAWSYDLTVGAVSAISESNKAIYLLGFDAKELSAVVKFPSNIIVQPIEKMGEKAVKLLLGRMNEPNKEVVNLVLDV